MTQLDFPLYDLPSSSACDGFVARSRRTDPATSKQAATAAKDLARQHAAKILDALRFGPAGVDRIAELAGLECHAVGKRMSELKEAGLARLTGKTVPSRSGRAQREWTL